MKQLSTLMIAVFLFTTITPTKAQVNTQDSLALVDLYDSTGGPNWTNHTNWLTSAPVSSWYGITAINSGYVYRIRLQGNRLSGGIPSSIGKLTNLSFLNLSGNQLTGSIPASLGNLIKLGSLELIQNQLSGSIPSSLGNLSSLSTLYLYENQLTDSIPSSFGNLSKLTYFEIERNMLSGSIPSSFGNLFNLVTLDLGFNQLSGSIPSSLGNLRNLTGLFLSDNQLSGSIPSSFGNLRNLTGLLLSDNQLSGSTSSLVNSTNLIHLYLYDNQFTFTGIEDIAKLAPGFDTLMHQYYNIYTPQTTIKLKETNDVLSASVGGTPSNDTFRWYRDSVLVATKVGDSTYTITSNGTYWAVATNAVATQLTLYSDTITITTLPIKSINLHAKETNGQVLLQWQTIDEVNTASFTIQHSTDGKIFSDIATKEAVGSGNNGYSFSPPSPLKGGTYYRIKAIDKDGSFSYSNVASVQFTVNSNQLTVYPNPSRDNVTIKGYHIGSIQVIDNMGRVVKVVELKDATNPTLSLSSLPAGLYHLRIQTNDDKVSSTALMVSY